MEKTNQQSGAANTVSAGAGNAFFPILDAFNGIILHSQIFSRSMKAYFTALVEQYKFNNADKDMIKRLMCILLDNAIKYTPTGGKISILAMIDSDNVRIRVADTGCGISPEDLPRIKEKFYKANFSTKGSGIGLAVCDEIINLHKGTLEISSVYGEGTEVNITLPTLPVNLSERKDS